MSLVLSSPPPTPIEPVTDVLHGVSVTDPYRWLEDQNSPRTRQWIAEQTSYARAHLDALPGRAQIKKRVEELLSIGVIPQPWNVGDRYFFQKRYGKSEQPVIVMREGLRGEDRILIDPAKHGGDPAVAVGIAAVSGDGRFLVYSVRKGGTDYSAFEILDIERNIVLSDRLPDGWCNGIAFSPDGAGFYYSHRKVDDLRPNYKAVFWHRFGTDRSQDDEIFFAGEEPNLFLGIVHPGNSKVLLYTILSVGRQRRTAIYVHNIQLSEAPRLLIDEVEGCVAPFFIGDQLFAYTDISAPNFRIVRIEITRPDPSRWQDIVPESDRRIHQFAVAQNRIFVNRIDHFSSNIEAFGLDGVRTKETRFPPHGTIDLLNKTKTTNKLFFNYSSVCTPPTIFCYDAGGKELFAWSEMHTPIDSCEISTQEIVYPSKDGTPIPLFLAVRKDRLHSCPLPTFLTGYGGFGSCVVPRFSAFATFLIEQGCLFAVPALRGGAELGENWHLAGRGKNRRNCFDDFIAAAEWLVSQGYSAPDRIAIGGGSNAGLLVGAAITQRPDLFRVAVCLGPLLDMTRYHLFDFAAGWADEYGSPDDEGEFRCLFSYSPYHRVQDDREYPAVLFISGDADTRCNAMHARKMTARLQAANISDHPTLIDYKPNWGHTPVQPLSAKIEALTDRLAFVCHELGVPIQIGRLL